MSMAKQLKNIASLFAVSALMLVNTSCEKSSGVDPVTPGGEGPGTETKITEVTLLNKSSDGSKLPAVYFAYNPVDSTLEIEGASLNNSGSTIKLKATANPTGRTINADGLLPLLKPDNFDLAQTSSGGSVVFPYLKKKDQDIKIYAEGSYIGQGSTAATQNNKIVAAEYGGTKDMIIIDARNNGLTPIKNAENMVSVFRKIEIGELKLKLLGQSAKQDGIAYNISLIAK